MRWRPLSWVGLGLLALALFLALDREATTHHEDSRAFETRVAGERLIAGTNSGARPAPGRFDYRLTNTSKSVEQLARSETGILLENALLDTSAPAPLPIPELLRTAVNPGSYIVQSRGPINARFRARVQTAGGSVVGYIPNNAFLVRASDAQAQSLASCPEVQAVLPFEPYYKLKPSLLKLVLNTPAPAGGPAEVAGGLESAETVLHLLLFDDARQEAAGAIGTMHLQSLGEGTSPFGPVLTVRCALSQVAALARLPGIQEVELASRPAPANDLSRALLGVSTNSVTTENYLGLTGTNVLVNVNDTGVDATQPELTGRVFSDLPGGSLDANGHGTHVAAIIAGSGAQSDTVTNAPGSSLPAAPFQFRGKAPEATLFSVVVDLNGPAPGSEIYLQQAAARTNVLISNNSWLYSGRTEYDLAAASFDAAARDALPGVAGSQPVLFVFAAGNHGAGANDGTGGVAGTIQSPATAKNVITVGAMEQARFITNETWTCTTNGTVTCQTNTPWLGLTDGTNEVAGFSARGNVGIGVEGASGRFKPDVVAPGTFIISARSSQWNQQDYYSQTNNALTPMPDENYFEVLSNLNDSLGPFYRFESGTSLAAADVSGVLALMQDFFQNRLGRTNSPALMKSLLLNGARPLGGNYDLHPGSHTNFQGWGLVNLTNSLPAALTNPAASSRPMFLFDQSVAGALATGDSRTRFVTVSGAARGRPLRVTLAWTDPPGNPVAGLKLVNDLDLVVTNLETGEVYWGNDIPLGQVFNQPWDTNTPPNVDFVNNVENVFLAPPLGDDYSVTVIGRRVNVNAVTANTNGVVQDYALVIASANGQLDDALTVTDSPFASAPQPLVTAISNTFLLSSGDVGSVLLHQRAGANPVWPATNTVALPGFSNAVLTVGLPSQWHFYVVSNGTSFTNAAFATFLSAPIAGSQTQSNFEPADIDLYVSQNPALTNLDPGALAAADKSLGRGGNETVIYSNAQPVVYYLGVKSESQRGAEYGLLTVFSQSAFAEIDPLGNQVLRGLPGPAWVSGGTSDFPGMAEVFCLSAQSIPVRRVIVTNVLTAASMGDLAGALAHERVAVGLCDHATNGALNQQPFIYDDSGEGDVPGGQTPDGPGSLRDFGAMNALGQWRLTMLDTNQAATNESLSVFLEQQLDLTAGITPSIASGACRQDYVFVPLSATNLTAMVNLVTGSGPVSVQLCPSDAASTNCLTLLLGGPGATVVLPNDATTHPRLQPGLYVLRACNLGPDVATVTATATIQSDPGGPAVASYVSSNAVALADDALTSSSMLVTNHEQIAAASVGVRVQHPRVSDLVLRLVSPEGRRVLLSENRGGASTNGMGCDVLLTNSTQVSYTGGPEAVTNVVDTGENGGTVLINYDFYALPDDMHVYYEGALIYDSGFVSNTGMTNLAFGPGASTLLTIVMNEGGNPDTNTAWYYSVTSTHLAPEYLTFLEDTNLATTPIKFAPPPLSASNYFGTGSGSTNGIFYLPERPLDTFLGRPAFGEWTLEVADTRAGATNPAPALASWRLDFVFRNTRPLPLTLPPGQPGTNTLGAGQVQWFAVAVPAWASFASNVLVSATLPVNVWYNATTPPTGTNASDFAMLVNSSAGAQVLQTNGVPPLVPGSTYFLGVQNTNAAAVTFVMAVNFDVASVLTLQSGVPYANTNAGLPSVTDYYRYVVSTNAVRAQFEINGPSADLTLVLRRGLPLPTPRSFDYRSANPGTNDELIVLYNFSGPMALSPGDWFLGVVNSSGAPATYSVVATEFAGYGTNLFITNLAVTSNSFCLTWDSLPGIHYFVQGKANLDDPKWTTLTSTLTATDYSTSYCVPLPSPFHFFRVHEGLVLVAPPLLIGSLTATNGGVVLNWTAATNSQFRVQWTPTLSPSSWTNFTNIIISASGAFSFFDDGSQTGGAARTRFYRLVRSP
jgi:subtilisin-like proprotein convertase family protein